MASPSPRLSGAPPAGGNTAAGILAHKGSETLVIANGMRLLRK
ncbi:MAG: hypothetical protein ACYC6L_03150 [Anaerolineae bacterium]